jgi:hypothetical protein
MGAAAARELAKREPGSRAPVLVPGHAAPGGHHRAVIATADVVHWIFSSTTSARWEEDQLGEAVGEFPIRRYAGSGGC